MKFLELLKQAYDNFITVLGGPLFKKQEWANHMVLCEDVDVIVDGEGEETICELLKIVKEGESLDKCKGVYFKKDNRVAYTGKRPLIKSLDRLPFLDLWQFPVDKYNPPPHRKGNLSMLTSRGCLWKCCFCGSCKYWDGYRTMSGRRIYEEVVCHLQSNPQIKHIEFLDLLFNGNIKVLKEFCDLMIKNKVKVNWHANAIVRHDMSEDILKKMSRAGCYHLTFGIESGSQRVIELMHKNYRVSDASKVLKACSDANIKVTCNFMFGFPGEKEEDFQLTLDFLKKNAPYINVVYPSRSFCSLESESYINENPEEFGIKISTIHPHYWETNDGSNNYLVRRDRCERFSRLADSYHLLVGLGLQTSLELDKWYNSGNYYVYNGNYLRAEECFLNYLKIDPENAFVQNKIKMCDDMISGNRS